MKRAYDPEILDEPLHDPDELEGSLAQVADVNRFLGGNRALRRTLGPLLGSVPEAALLDVGAGNADGALDLARWALARGQHWRITALDLHAQTVTLAARRVAHHRPSVPVTVIRGDALALPFADRSFDAAYTVLTLHHFREGAAVRLLREMARVVRHAVIVNDLERNRAAWMGARVLAATAWRRNRITRHDGPLSVRRAFTPDELLALAEAAGLRTPQVRRHFPFRLVLQGAP